MSQALPSGNWRSAFGQPLRMLEFNQTVIQPLQSRRVVLEHGRHRVGGRGDVFEAQDHQCVGRWDANQLQLGAEHRDQGAFEPTSALAT